MFVHRHRVDRQKMTARAEAMVRYIVGRLLDEGLAWDHPDGWGNGVLALPGMRAFRAEREAASLARVVPMASADPSVAKPRPRL